MSPKLLGFRFKISFVRVPVPGPISIIFLFLTTVKDTIFFIMFLSIKNFDLGTFYSTFIQIYLRILCILSN